MTVSNGANGAGDERNPNGTFRNYRGPGNPRIRLMARHQAAVAHAVEPKVLALICRRLAHLAVTADPGNAIAASRTLLDRLLGPARTADAPMRLPFALPALSNAGGVLQLQERVLQAVADGSMAADSAAQLMSFSAQLMHSIEVNDLHRRLEALEATVQTERNHR